MRLDQGGGSLTGLQELRLWSQAFERSADAWLKGQRTMYLIDWLIHAWLGNRYTRSVVLDTPAAWVNRIHKHCTAIPSKVISYSFEHIHTGVLYHEY